MVFKCGVWSGLFLGYLGVLLFLAWRKIWFKKVPEVAAQFVKHVISVLNVSHLGKLQHV